MAGNPDRRYIGRFAPSPTGPLHAGSLLAALASYLDARAHRGRWLLRMEDIDLHRNVSGAADAILHALEAHHLYWDGELLVQSNRDAYYTKALQALSSGDHVFYCDCSRKLLKQHARKGGGAYPGFCRHLREVAYHPADATHPASHAIRFDTSTVPASAGRFVDRILGPQQFDMETLGDFIVRRRDSLFAYQLAVVVDDAEQGITDIVRGADLLTSTPWQIGLQHALGMATPRYAHLPLLVHPGEQGKLSKQTGASAIDNNFAYNNLCRALAQLGQTLPADVADSTQLQAGNKAGIDKAIEELLAHAVINWRIEAVPGNNVVVTGQSYENQVLRPQ